MQKGQDGLQHESGHCLSLSGKKNSKIQVQNEDKGAIYHLCYQVADGLFLIRMRDYEPNSRKSRAKDKMVHSPPESSGKLKFITRSKNTYWRFQHIIFSVLGQQEPHNSSDTVGENAGLSQWQGGPDKSHSKVCMGRKPDRCGRAGHLTVTTDPERPARPLPNPAEAHRPSRKGTILPLLLKFILNLPKKFILILEGLHSICVILKVLKQHLQVSTEEQYRESGGCILYIWLCPVKYNFSDTSF